MPTTKPLVTAEDLLRPGTPYDRGELWGGAWVVREPSGGPSEIVGGQIYGPVWLFVQQRALGWVTGSSQGFFLKRSPDWVLSPDVAFTSYGRMSAAPRRSFIDGAPDFVVEVVSPEDTWEEQVAKGGVWIGHGVLVVWVVDPETKRVAVLRPGRAPQILVGEGVADASPALPEFRLSLADVFARIP